MEKIEWHDVQALVLSGYPELPYAAYVLWHFLPPDEPAGAKEQEARARDWLKKLIPQLIRGDAVKDDDQGLELTARPTNLKSLKKTGYKKASAINVALTASGLAGLGVPADELSLFSAEFREGMAPEPAPGNSLPRRANVLGDVDKNAPNCWDWGGWRTDRIDGVLFLYASDETSLKALISGELAAMKPFVAPVRNCAGDPLILNGRIWEDLTEHFGFKDGISQPVIDGTKKAKEMRQKSPKEARISIVKPGEILLGYPNERGARVTFSSAPQATQARATKGAGSSRDLARNGTYLVFRQLEQNVALFRKEIARTATHLRGSDDKKSRDWVAARVVGRTPDGEPLIPPAADSVVADRNRNDFLYHFEDRFGLHCPLGAHVRRANPRDIIGPNPESALRLSKMHRIIRRGRPYGEKLLTDTPAEASNDEDASRGMLFIALNADIAGQFELIQHSWINNGRFNGLYDEMDPLVHFPGEKRVMTIQRRPTCMPVDGLEQFVTVRGGAYFFLPGIQALQSLAQ